MFIKNIKKFFKGLPKPVIIISKLFLFLFLIGVIAGLLMTIYYIKDLPQPEIFNEVQVNQSTEIYDRTGKQLLYKFGPEDREIITLSQTPLHLRQAIMAAEDSNFYNHPGVDLTGVLRSIKYNITLGTSIGGSTLTQQLIRTTFLTRDKVISRKIKELILSLQLELRYSKDQILEWYLNRVPYSGNIYGVQQASKVYFGKEAEDLSINESAVLAAAIQLPSYFSPFGSHVDKLIERKNNYVLKRMYDENFITKEEYENALIEPIQFVANKESLLAPHFSLYVKQWLVNEYGYDFLNENGLKIYTTLDWDLQKEAERIVKEVAKINLAYNAHNAAATVVNPQNGEILAMVGSKDYFGATEPADCVANCLFDPQVNMATYGNGRQPGSTFKPFAYVTAFKKGYTDKTIIIDEPTNFGVWGDKEYKPENYDGTFRGAVTIRQALAQSLNIPAIKTILYLAGINDTAKTAADMGITTLKAPYGPSIVLGGWEVRLLELTSAFGVFGNSGVKVTSHPILRIEDSTGNIIKSFDYQGERVLNAEHADMITSILSDNDARAPMFGYRSNLYFDSYPVAAKTGTTNDMRDGWTVGFTPLTAVGVWAGNNNNETTTKIGTSIAGPIFHQLMQECLFRYPPTR